MKYLMMVVSGLLAALAGLAWTRHYSFVAPLTNWPLFITTATALALMMVRKPWKIMAAGMALIGASLIEFVGAFFCFIGLILAATGTANGGVVTSLVDLVILLVIGLLSFLTSWLALGWGVWHTISTPRQVFRPFLHA